MNVTANITVVRHLPACEVCATIYPREAIGGNCLLCSGRVELGDCDIELVVHGVIDDHDARRPCWGDFEIEACHTMLDFDDAELCELTSDENYKACMALLAALQERKMESEVEDHGP